jgi:hypothetical protein
MQSIPPVSERTNRRPRHTTSTVLALLVLGASASACGSGGDHGAVVSSSEPPWERSGEARDFPSELYLTGLGEGTTAKAAADAARAEIASVFSVEVSDEVSALKRFVYIHDGDARWTHGHQSVQQVTRSRTRAVLRGVEISKRRRDGREHHALATLHREQAARRLRAELASLDRELDMLVFAPAAGDEAPLRRVRRLQRAVFLHAVRKIMVSKLHVVDDADGERIQPSVTSTTLVEQLEQALTACPVYVRGKGDHAGQARDAFATAAVSGSARLVTTDEPRRAALVVEASVELGAVEDDEPPFVYTRWRVTLRLIDPRAGGDVLLTLKDQGRQGHKTPDGATQRALRAACGRIGDALAPQVAAAILGGGADER